MKICFDMDGVLSEDDRMFKAIHNVPLFYDKLKPLPGAVELFMEVWKILISGVPLEMISMAAISANIPAWHSSVSMR